MSKKRREVQKTKKREKSVKKRDGSMGEREVLENNLAKQKGSANILESRNAIIVNRCFRIEGDRKEKKRKKRGEKGRKKRDGSMGKRKVIENNLAKKKAQQISYRMGMPLY